MISLSDLTSRVERDAHLVDTKEKLTEAYGNNIDDYRALNNIYGDLDNTRDPDIVKMSTTLNATRKKIVTMKESSGISLDQGLGITGLGSLSLSLAVPTSATVALPLSLTIIGALGVKKMLEGCSKPSEKVKTEPSAFTSYRRDTRPEGKRPLSDPLEEFYNWAMNVSPRIIALRNKHSAQIDDFHNWAKSAYAKKDWSKFHNSHYDWWAFPISRASKNNPQYAKYAITSHEAQLLKGDREFMPKYRHGVKLVMQSYGFDVEKGVFLKNGGKYAGGSKHYRLQKILGSLKLFGETTLYNKVMLFATQVGESDGRYF